MPIQTYTPEDLARITATPAALGKHIGQEFMGRPYKAYPWVLYMEQKILAMMYRPGNEILIVSCPPQQGKSTYCSMLLPAWYLGRNPGHTVMNISYNENQAAKWGLRTRNLMRRYGEPLFGASINADSDSQTDWKMGNGFGGMMSAGIQGGLSGNPADWVVCDDTLKNMVEANSPVTKKRNLEEWDGSISSRFQNNTKVLMVATRWSLDDLSGELWARAQAPDYDGWPVQMLNIKAMAEPDPEELSKMSDDELAEWTDFLGRHYGEGLPGQHSQRFFEVKKASTPIGVWMSLHQGTPTYAIGGMFPEADWRFWIPENAVEKVPGDVYLPEMVKMVRVWDLASSEGSGDFTVGTLMGRSRANDLYVLDRERFRFAPGAVEERIKAIAKSDADNWGCYTVRIEQERSGAGITVVDHYKRELLGYDVDGCKAEGDKESRATPYSIAQNSHRVYLPRHAEWAKEWITEHSQMDGKGARPKHDDQIDTGAYAVRYLVSAGESIIWDLSGLQGTDDMSPEERLEIEAIKMMMGQA